MTHAIVNVDSSEIAKFSVLAQDWWNPFGDCKPLHDINPLRLNFIKQHTSLENKKVLDIGCGGGILTESLAKEGAQAVGIDMSKEAIEVATRHAADSELPIEYVFSSAEDYTSLYPKQFDIITCMELLEHVPNPASIIYACSQLLKPNGQVFFSTINRNPKAFLFAIVGAEYFLRLLPRGTHEYGKFMKPHELEAMMRTVDLRINHIEGMQYNPITKKYRLTQDVSVNYLVHGSLLR